MDVEQVERPPRKGRRVDHRPPQSSLRPSEASGGVELKKKKKKKKSNKKKKSRQWDKDTGENQEEVKKMPPTRIDHYTPLSGQSQESPADCTLDQSFDDENCQNDFPVEPAEYDTVFDSDVVRVYPADTLPLDKVHSPDELLLVPGQENMFVTSVTSIASSEKSIRIILPKILDSMLDDDWPAPVAQPSITIHKALCKEQSRHMEAMVQICSPFQESSCTSNETHVRVSLEEHCKKLSSGSISANNSRLFAEEFCKNLSVLVVLWCNDRGFALRGSEWEEANNIVRELLLSTSFNRPVDTIHELIDNVIASGQQYVDLFTVDADTDSKIRHSISVASDISNAVTSKDSKRLEELNVDFVVTGLERLLQYGFELSTNGIYKVVDSALQRDYGSFVWLSDNQPERLITQKIIERILISLPEGAKSKDNRLAMAYFKTFTKAFQDLDESSVDYFIEEYALNDKNKLDEALRYIEQGYIMSAGRERIQEYRERNNVHVFERILKFSPTQEEIKSILLYIAVAAKFGHPNQEIPYDYGRDSFCACIGRVLCLPIDDTLKKLFLDFLFLSVLSLPKSMLNVLLPSKENVDIGRSLYFSYDFCVRNSSANYVYENRINSMNYLASKLQKSILLEKVFYPALILGKAYRDKIVPLITNWLSNDDIVQQIFETDCAHVVSILSCAIIHYARTSKLRTGSEIPKRDQFIALLLTIVCRALKDEEISPIISQSISELFQKSPLAWFERIGISETIFADMKHILPPPSIPEKVAVDDVLGILKSICHISIWNVFGTIVKGHVVCLNDVIAIVCSTLKLVGYDDASFVTVTSQHFDEMSKTVQDICDHFAAEPGTAETLFAEDDQSSVRIEQLEVLKKPCFDELRACVLRLVKNSSVYSTLWNEILKESIQICYESENVQVDCEEDESVPTDEQPSCDHENEVTAESSPAKPATDSSEQTHATGGFPAESQSSDSVII